MSVSVITGLCPSLMAQARASGEGNNGNIATVLSTGQGGCGVINIVSRLELGVNTRAVNENLCEVSQCPEKATTRPLSYENFAKVR